MPIDMDLAKDLLQELSLDELQAVIATSVNGIRNSPFIDDDTAVFAIRQLTGIIADIYKIDRDPLNMAIGKILPLEMFGGSFSFKTQIEIPVYDTFGFASIINDDSTEGGQEVGMIVRRALFSVRTLSAKVRYSLLTLKTAQAEGIPLESYKIEALRDSIDRYIDRGGWFGDPSYGLQGILNSGIPFYTSPVTFGAAASADQLLSLLTTPVSVCRKRSRVSRPKKLVLPETQLNLLNDTYRSGTDRSVLQSFLDSQARVGGITAEDVIVDDTLSGAGANGEDLMLIAPYDKRRGSLGLVHPLEILPPQFTGFDCIVHGYARTALAMIKEPLTFQLVRGV